MYSSAPFFVVFLVTLVSCRDNETSTLVPISSAHPYKLAYRKNEYHVAHPNEWLTENLYTYAHFLRCSKCTDRLEQERLKRLARTPGADRATRMDDMSSDDDDVSSSADFVWFR